MYSLNICQFQSHYILKIQQMFSKMYNVLSVGEKSSVSELQCRFQGMSTVVYAPRMKVIHAFGGTFPITEKVIYTFIIMLSITVVNK